jgi:hypothetical protein
MGISGFFSFLKNQFPGAIVGGLSGTIDHLLIDVNNFIHLPALRCSEWDKFIMMVLRRFHREVDVILPTKSIYFAMDGVGSFLFVCFLKKKKRHQGFLF